MINFDTAQEQSESVFEPTVLGAAWRYRWLVVFLVVAFGALGWLWASQGQTWSAEASVGVQDPRTSSVFEGVGFLDPARFVEDQAAIMRSRVVVQRAVELAAQQDPPVVVEVDTAVESIRVESLTTSNLINLSYTAPTPLVAQVMVNAVAEAYREVGRASAEEVFSDALTNIDQSIAEIKSELEAIRRQLIALQAIDPDRQQLELQFEEAVDQLVALSEPSANATPEELALTRARLDVLRARLDALDAALVVTELDPEVGTLTQEEEDARQRLADLASRRDQLAVNAELASSTISFYSPAERSTQSAGILYVVLGALVGLFAGVAIAYVLARRSLRFTERTQPEVILQVPLLADVPNFKEERVRSSLPVADAPISASAESLRFVAAAITLQQVGNGGGPALSFDGQRAFKSVAIASGGPADGKTVVAANTAFAAAREGSRVLVIDGDFGNQGLTSLLMPGAEPTVGLTEVATGKVDLVDAVGTVTIEGGGSIDVLARGSDAVTALDFFNSKEAALVFDILSKEYDLVLVDAPPLLSVAYASTVVRYADRAMVIVAHGSTINSAEDMRGRLDLIGTPVLGYVYNQAPLRPEMALTSGSMADVLGKGRPPTPATERTERAEG